MVETAEAKQVCNAASTLLFPKLDFGVKQCGKYTREDFLEILSRIAFDQEFQSITSDLSESVCLAKV